MGQAIGKSVAACLEIAYWLTLKPLVFWLQSRKKRNVPSENATRVKGVRASVICGKNLCNSFNQIYERKLFVYSVYLQFT